MRTHTCPLKVLPPLWSPPRIFAFCGVSEPLSFLSLFLCVMFTRTRANDVCLELGESAVRSFCLCAVSSCNESQCRSRRATACRDIWTVVNGDVMYKTSDLSEKICKISMHV